NMINPTQFMNDLIATATQKMNDSGLVHGFADKSERGYKFQVRCEIINTNSKVNQYRKIWWINDNRSSAQKVHDLLKSL
ncbi:TPA: hypothetical protein I6671_003525, partial [Vibrio cholerae]|nr:hypothetical protein [Vibrio cholerae]HDP8598924.1 hypothetical protein [Vibrio cholerae]